MDIMYDVNYAKYTQNPKMYKTLMDTSNTILVEASPYDKIWGIGLDENTAKITDPKNWPGENLLGKVLDKVRNRLL
jgi:ribA/ribD-fused uncharacterized protein